MYIRKNATVVFTPPRSMTFSEADKFITDAKKKYKVKVSYDKSLLAQIDCFSMKATGKLESMVNFITNELYSDDRILCSYNEIIPAKGDPWLLGHMIWKSRGII